MAGYLNPMAILRSLDCGHFQVLHRVEGGADTKIWKAVSGDTLAALRVFRPSQLMSFKQELEAMATAAKVGLPVPTVIDSGIFEGQPCMLIEWIDGTSMFDACNTQPNLKSLSLQFGEMSKMLHQKAKATDGSSLLHMDYHPLNVIAKKGKIVGIIDWTNSKYGNPMQDVARTVSLLICTPIISREDKQFARTLRRIARHFLIGYGDTTDLKRYCREAANDLEHELDYHIRENGLYPPKHARRIISRWRHFNQ